ncbi:hypothetical protein [Candidatus Accumulibacter sp. ACC012]|uniref:hypothetical protein n=1 Tax=Candidatus Accumulibacter sp. ACC012 TaxID=2823332 RepID=UPI0025BF9D3C|nr:hypothetical protein [Candidatus Accumulibacter sp. ACC012]
MPEYLSPGVYVEEVSSGIKPVEGVGTSTGAFVGIAQRGPIGKPRLITNWTQFTATFGGFVENGYLAYAVYQFFSEGGTRCYVIRAAKGSATTLKKAETAAMGSLVVRANSEGIWGNALSAVVADETTLPGGSVRIDYFQLSIVYDGAVVEAFDNVTLDEARPDHVLKRVDSKWVEMVDNGATRPPNGTTPLAGGLDGDTLLSSDGLAPPASSTPSIRWTTSTSSPFRMPSAMPPSRRTPIPIAITAKIVSLSRTHPRTWMRKGPPPSGWYHRKPQFL